ncbi:MULTISPECIES: FtsW/RodA/SpoVE family cell cycle protein [Sulfurovum]|uniref:FtsW/RodA/SpoVE family cell cycle protein n=1 Tax=Sulfurovum xiamenensis TaxID=3019066 RepID=A0ABT7QTS8_9BACT|nr:MULTISPECIES: FtsW/RodA/SpoVE family cell cycle protein [Sulfurovum]EIF52028.1 cell shape-determining protein RodA [Sulfurovum sp. AR]MDM5264497.1 FtsW/RodA/SpoVE family cell cycle protein [Sulfurovum xiamenensis]
MESWLDFDKRIFKHFSYLLVLQIIPLLVISSYLVNEINPYLFTKQMVYYFIAGIAFLVAAFIPWRQIIWWFVPIFYLGNLGLLIAVEFVGKKILGAQRWIEIPGIGITIQPSEFIKVSVIMMLGYLISRNPPGEKGYGILNFIKLSIVIIIPFLLIAKEPDLGTALVLLITGYGVLFVVGINWKIWVSIVIILGLSAPLLYSQLKPYQKKRVTDFIGKPSYHVRQALIAIGSGGVEGKSKEEATQTQLKFLPVSSTDFIFAYLGERFGFKGMITVIVLYMFLIFNLLYISAKYATDYLIKAFASGLAFLFFVYMGVNIYMVIGLAPVVGLPLPMFSHGGTSFIIFAVIFGILQNLIAFKDYSRYNSDAKITMISKDQL